MIERAVDLCEELDQAAGVGHSATDDEDDELFPDFSSQQSPEVEPAPPIW